MTDWIAALFCILLVAFAAVVQLYEREKYKGGRDD